VNHTRFPKENHLPYWARRGNRDKKGDRVDYITENIHKSDRYKTATG